MIYAKKRISALLLFLFFISLLCGADQDIVMEVRNKVSIIVVRRTELHAGVFGALQEHIFDAGVIAPGFQAHYRTPEEQAERVYTFLQGPRAFGESLPWSGEWCEQMIGYNKFGGFGCGFCCMANIYSTLTPYECSPWDMFEFAIGASEYYPTAESGAIGWEDMKATLQAAGLVCEVYRKPATYEEFQEQMQHTQSAVVLVSSAEDATFWQDTPGHYVNIWLYQKSTDMVFLAEPGNPENNRTWIPLRYLYDALKTVSPYQYLAVTSYAEESNAWKSNGIDEFWHGKVSN